jgi:hypothetical protein
MIAEEITNPKNRPITLIAIINGSISRKEIKGYYNQQE